MAETETTLEGVPTQDADTGGRVATTGSIMGAVAMTSCCILPLALVSMGVGGVWIAQLTALYAYKWFTFGIASMFLAWGFYKAYRPLAACADGTACARPINRQIMRGALWVSTFVVLVALAFPYLTPFIFKAPFTLS
jgi:mercuric ion transport protein